MNTRDAAAQTRARWPGGNTIRAAIIRPNESSIARPLLRRWTNSMMVLAPGATGTITPLQDGQWLPHPAPDPVARTTAPQMITTTGHTESDPGQPAECPHRQHDFERYQTDWL
jgi:hypothetical protein